MITRRHAGFCSLAFLGAAMLPFGALAQTDKLLDRPIRLVVPFAAGGGVDVFARLLGEQLKQQHNYTVVVENRAGANGTVGGLAVKSAEPNGSTWLFSAGTHVMARHVMKSPPYDPIADFTPIARVGEAPMMLVMSPDRKPTTIGELVAEARLQPDKWTFSTSALGAPGHLATVAFNHLSGLNLTIVTYRGTAPALTDVAGGHVQLMIDPVLALLPMATDKKVIGLAVTSAKRTKLAPQLPTAAESGLPGLDYSTWYGVWGPRDMPVDLVAKLNAILNGAVAQLDKDGKLAQLGIEPVSDTPEQFSAFSKGYVTRNADLLTAAKFDPI